ncbi:type II toxin-antitoxin system death-on-curing family toxin [Flavobacteriales bacterium]|nr:type II toxin-antitoxin system death-on-curing family toxin [Flavobacteriales bacterium]
MEKPQEIVVFNSSQSDNEFQIILDGDNETVWITEKQIVELFGKARRTIGEHINNLYEEGELDKSSTWREFRQVQKEGQREVTRNVPQYNLDVIISVGYRVRSKTGIEFRKWATKKLKEHLIKGYTLNQNIQIHQIKELQNQLVNAQEKLFESQTQLTDGLLNIISSYSKSFELLNQFDTDELSTSDLQKDINYIINYADVNKAIGKLKTTLIEKEEASQLFGSEKDDSFRGILGSISQTVFGDLAYPTIEEQAAQLLYSIIKGHAFSDGNKRIGSFIFVWFLEQNNFHLKSNGQLKINDNTLVALALAVAQSIPDQRDIIIKLIINLIKN